MAWCPLQMLGERNIGRVVGGGKVEDQRVVERDDMVSLTDAGKEEYRKGGGRWGWWMRKWWTEMGLCKGM